MIDEMFLQKRGVCNFLKRDENLGVIGSFSGQVSETIQNVPISFPQGVVSLSKKNNKASLETTNFIDNVNSKITLEGALFNVLDVYKDNPSEGGETIVYNPDDSSSQIRVKEKSIEILTSKDIKIKCEGEDPSLTAYISIKEGKIFLEKGDKKITVDERDSIEVKNASTIMKVNKTEVHVNTKIICPQIECDNLTSKNLIQGNNISATSNITASLNITANDTITSPKSRFGDFILWSATNTPAFLAATQGLYQAFPLGGFKK